MLTCGQGFCLPGCHWGGSELNGWSKSLSLQPSCEGGQVKLLSGQHVYLAVIAYR